jgi:hypothetical protein
LGGLYLNCGLCGRRQADGLLSRGYWGHLELADGSALRACPTCKTSDDWESRLRASANGHGSGASVGSNPYRPSAA